uniref:Uncharacterized protein n=1 Tax=Anopheles atroparvus TaxID=41427 RepID=A0A182JGP0_ANOAO
MTQTCTQKCVRTQTVVRSSRPFPRPLLLSLALCLGIVGILADTTNPVFIQRDLPPAPYAYGLQDFDSSEEVTIVKRSGQTMLPGVTYLTTPQSEPTPMGQVQVQKSTTTAQALPLPLPLQQQQQKQAQQRAQASTEAIGASPVPPVGAGVGVANVPSSKQTVDQQASTANVADQQTSLIQVEMESVPKPEDLPQPSEVENSIPHKRNVYDAYATEAKSGGCGCGGYVLVEKKIYVCEPKETIVRLMKRSHDVCAAQETQHVGVIQSPDNDDQQRFQLIPIPQGMEQQ